MALAQVSGFTAETGVSLTTGWSSIHIDTTAAAGTAVVLILATDGVAGQTNDTDGNIHTSITDTQGNTWTKLAEWQVQFFDRTAIVSVWSGKITTQLVSGTDTLTASWSITLMDSGRAAIVSDKFSGAANGFTVAAENDAVTDVADLANSTISGLSNIERLFVRAQAEEGQDATYTPQASYTKFVGAALVSSDGVVSKSMKAYGEYRILTATGDSDNPAHAGADGRGADIYLALTPANNTPPVLDAIGSKSATPNVQLAFTATATDAEMGDTLTFSLVNSPPSGAAITTGGNFTWTPTHAQASGSPYTIRVQVSDGTDTDFEDISVTVSNTAPTLDAISDQSVAHGTQLTVNAAGHDVNTSDVLTYTIQSGSLTGMSIVGSTGVFTWTPTFAQVGATHSVTIRVTDDGADANLHADRTFNIAVTDTGPSLAAVANQTVRVGQTLSVQLSGSDPEGDTKTYSLVGSVPVGMVVGSSTGLITWTPTSPQYRTTPYSITARVTAGGQTADRTFSVSMSNAGLVPSKLSCARTPPR